MFELISLLLITLCFQQINTGYIEILETRGGETEQFFLTCRHFTSIIAILEAEFTAVINSSISSAPSISSPSPSPTPFPPVHPRQALNKRCSGVNHCAFILVEDCPGADEWGPGNLRIKYACISDDRVERYCNREIILPPVWFGSAITGRAVSDGFIHNPGYPRLYPGHRKCRWKIRAPPQQRIRVTILDVSMTADSPVEANECTDRLDIIEEDQIIHRTCSLVEPPVEIVSVTDTIEIVLSSRQVVNPRRGVLLRYTAVGCPTPGPPQDGYLVHRNDTAAEFSCCMGYVFSDTGKQKKTLECIDGRWDQPTPLSDCQGVAESTFVVKKPSKQSETMIDGELIPPIILIVALFGLNCIVLFFIYKKKKTAITTFTEEELNTLA